METSESLCFRSDDEGRGGVADGDMEGGGGERAGFSGEEEWSGLEEEGGGGEE